MTENKLQEANTENQKDQGFSDELIISKILAGEKNLFDVIMRKYNSRLYRICMSIINNVSEAEDIIQTTYINAYEHLSQFKKRSTFSTWLIKILINESFLQLRKKKNAMLIQ
jgi:DNA-directed RNA polymerase specialized sigma24 family protein